MLSSGLLLLLKRNWLKIVIVLLIISSLGYGYTMRKKAIKAEAERESLRAEMLTKTGQVETYKNEIGQTVTKLLEYEKHISELEFSNDSLEVEVYKTASAAQVKKKDIREAMVVYMKSANSGKVEKDTIFVYNDSLSVDTIYKTFNDGFLNASFNDSVLKYTYDEKIVLLKSIRKVKRNFFLWRWVGWKKKINKNLVEISSDNPNSKLNGRVIKLE